ncbi:hypothetical protein HDU83_002465 [Entophlyctis luteolus]|nr:hypothetical protein HDU83_002465 [Entophlyctis luteolus]
MGKDKHPKRPPRHNPLHVDIIADSPYSHSLAAALPPSLPPSSSTSKQPVSRQNKNPVAANLDVPDVPSVVDQKTSQKIIDIARRQQLEISLEEQQQQHHHLHSADNIPRSRSSNAASAKAKASMFKFADKPAAKSSFDSDDDADPENDADGADFDDFDNQYEANLDIDQSDALLIEKFLNPAPRKQATLADIIMEKLEEAEANAAAAVDQTTAGEAFADKEAQEAPQYKDSSNLDPKIVEVYSKVGVILSRYRSGKLPKAFKIIPALPNWEQVLYITNPDKWTPHATYQATRIFVSNLQSRMAQRFFNLFLLDRVRDDIAETKKLNYHLYLALKKSLYKPAAFFKGLLLPLCESGSCTLREAAIIGSVITKVSIPILDSAAALLKIAEMPYTGPNSLFIRILLDKKYALPYKVLDALVFHFLRFARPPQVLAASDDADTALPVLWHQSLLVFAQRYKGELVPEQKEALLELLKYRVHPLITPEIRREIVNSKCRGDVLDIDMMEA